MLGTMLDRGKRGFDQTHKIPVFTGYIPYGEMDICQVNTKTTLYIGSGMDAVTDGNRAL